MGTNADGSASGAGEGASGTQPAGSGGPAGGEGGSNGGGAPGTNAGGLDRSRLAPLLQSMSEEQINDTFNTMFAAMRRPAEVPPAPRIEAPKAPSREDLKERFDTMSDKFDPDGAVRDLVTANYGGLISEIGQKANEGMYMSLRATLPDFDKHEQDVRTVLKDVPANQINQNTLMNTYFSVVGAKTVGEQIKSRQAAPTTRQPSNQKAEDAGPNLTKDEEEVARVMFRNSADPLADYKKALKMVDEGSMSVKVPGDK